MQRRITGMEVEMEVRGLKTGMKVMEGHRGVGLGLRVRDGAQRRNTGV